MKVNIISAVESQATELLLPLTIADTQSPFFKTIIEKYGLSPAFANDFGGKLKEEATVYANHATVQKINFIGLGDAPAFVKIKDALRSFSFRKKEKLGAKLALDITFLTNHKWLEAAINGLELSDYDIQLYKTTDKKAHPLSENTLDIITNSPEDAEVIKAIKKGIATGETQKQAFDLINQPASHMYAQILADWVFESGRKHGYEVTILDKSDIQKEGMKALLAVNQGSHLPPKFIIAEHKPEGYENFKTVGLVGKGVTYDTGGLNIKTAGMRFMKSDMGGGVAVLCAMELVAKLNLPIHLIAIVPATDNQVDAKAISPGDVIGSYSGKTIEVIDTDAEGRLILADGLSYLVRNFEPEVVIDAATLTGSSVRTLGYYAAALFSNNEELARQLFDVGNKTGERLWQLPLYEEHQAELKSDIADIANLGSRPMGGASTAAKFLENFIDNHPKWAHIDIAGVAYGDSEYGAHKSGTAFGVKLLVEYLASIC